MKKKKILFFVTEDWYFISHRISFAEYLIKKGNSVSLCCKDTGKMKYIKERGIDCFNLDVNRKSLSIIKFFFEFLSYIKVATKVNAHIIHYISVRPTVIGIFSSIFIKSKFFCTLTGMGFLFIKKGIITFFIKNLIIKLLKLSSILNNIQIILQNKDDQMLFLNKFNFNKKYIKVIRGSGIDLNFFKYVPEKKNKIVNISFAGRLLKDKGIFWLIDAFQEARKTFKDINLYVAGSFDENNPTSISQHEFNSMKKIKGIHFLGNINDIRKFWEEANIAILLSKREGLPLSLMEAASVGRAIIATNVTGCREIAINGYNALTVQPGDIEEIKNAIIKLSKSYVVRKSYGKRSRKLVESDLELEHICNQYYKLYNK